VLGFQGSAWERTSRRVARDEVAEALDQQPNLIPCVLVVLPMSGPVPQGKPCRYILLIELCVYIRLS
jgi:hypothetical protein